MIPVDGLAQRPGDAGLGEQGGADHQPAKPGRQPLYRLAFFAEPAPALLINQAERAGLFREAQIGVVFAQQQAIFGPAGKHAIRLRRALRDQVVNQHAQIGLVAAREPGRLVFCPPGRVQAGQQTLRGGLFITRGAIDLAGKEQPLDKPGLQPGIQLARVEKIIFDRITGADDMGLLKALDRAHQGQLRVIGQGSGDAVRIDLAGGQALRFDEDLMRRPVGKAHHLVLHGRAITRPGALDIAVIKRRAVQRGADDRMSALIGVGDMAGHLRGMLPGMAEIGKHRPGPRAGLNLQAAVVDGAPVYAGRRAGLQAADAKRQFTQPPGQRVGRRVARAPAGMTGLADVDAPAEEGARGQHHAGRVKAQARLRHHALDLSAADNQVIDRLLKER